MKRLALPLPLAIALLAIGTIGLPSNAFAFSIAVDVPTQYTFDERTFTTDKGAKFKDQTVNDVSGFKVLLTGMRHIGVGYENYEVKGKGDTGNETFGYRINFQFYDLVLDLPTRWLNFGLGYGVGTVNTSVLAIGDPPIAKEADASQWFASIGIPLGNHFDIHAAYHAVKVEDQSLSNTGGGAKEFLTVSGHTIMAGIRLGW